MDEQNVKQKTGAATAALVLGILAFITTILLVNYIFGLIAIVLGLVFLLSKKEQKKGKARAITGISLAAVSLVLSTVLWVGLYVFITTASLPEMMAAVKFVTGGAVDPEVIINETIESYVTDVLDEKTLTQVEEFLGGEVNYETLTEFVGEEVTVETIINFADGQEIDAEEVTKAVANMDTKAALEDLGGEVNYKVLEDKLGKGFKYDDVMDYLNKFQK